MIEDFKIKTNDKGEILIQINRFNTDAFLTDCIAVRYSIGGSTLILNYDHKDVNLDLWETVINGLSKKSITRIRKQKIIHIMEVCKKKNTVYSAFEDRGVA